VEHSTPLLDIHGLAPPHHLMLPDRLLNVWGKSSIFIWILWYLVFSSRFLWHVHDPCFLSAETFLHTHFSLASLIDVVYFCSVLNRHARSRMPDGWWRKRARLFRSLDLCVGTRLWLLLFGTVMGHDELCLRIHHPLASCAYSSWEDIRAPWCTSSIVAGAPCVGS
jgi:hypothetical protein